MYSTYLIVAIYKIPGYTGTGICNLLLIELSYSFVQFQSVSSKGTKGLPVLVDYPFFSIGTIYSNVFHHVCTLFVGVGCNQHLGVVGCFSYQGCVCN